MDWLYLLVAHPAAFASFRLWLSDREKACAEFALDVGEDERKSLKGKRDAFREIQAYMNNNMERAKLGLHTTER